MRLGERTETPLFVSDACDQPAISLHEIFFVVRDFVVYHANHHTTARIAERLRIVDQPFVTLPFFVKSRCRE
jgi:hypothetical protein